MLRQLHGHNRAVQNMYLVTHYMYSSNDQANRTNDQVTHCMYQERTRTGK